MYDDNNKPDLKEYFALAISGVCLGWLESTRDADEVSTILGIAVTIIAGTVLLGASVKFNTAYKDENWMKQLVNAEKSVWPFAIFLLAFTIGPPVIEFLIGLVSSSVD